jgi:hypothetical protein
MVPGMGHWQAIFPSVSKTKWLLRKNLEKIFLPVSAKLTSA